MTTAKRVLIIFTMILAFTVNSLTASACNSCGTDRSHDGSDSWFSFGNDDFFSEDFLDDDFFDFDDDWFSFDDDFFDVDESLLDFDDDFFADGWFYREDSEAEARKVEAFECDDECGCDNKPVVTAPTCEREGDFFAYRQGNCVGCKIDFHRWSSTDDMEDFIPEGATIRVEGGVDVYIVKYKNGKMFKRLVLNPQVFENYEHLRWEDVMNVSEDVLDAYTTSDLVRSEETGKVYRLYPNGDCGTKHLVEYHGCFWNRIDWDSVYTINGYDEKSYTTSSSLK